MSQSTTPKTRELTEEEENLIPASIYDTFFDLIHERFQGEFLDRPVFSKDGHFPWIFLDTLEEVTIKDFARIHPHISHVHNLDYTSLIGDYQSKKVEWSYDRNRWEYKNRKPVQFSDSEEEPSDHEEEATSAQETQPEAQGWSRPRTPPSGARSARSESSDQEEVSQILGSVTRKVKALITTVSQPQTPQAVPGALPVTPAQASQSFLPTPSATAFPLPPAVPPVRVATPTPSQRPSTPAHSSRSTSPSQPSTPSTPSTPASMSGSANTKLLGSPPESFDGSPAKAEAFWNNLENYYYLNESTYSDQGKRVSAALTHFKVGTSAGEWAQDKQKRALSVTPVDFGTWVDFRDSFKKHFVPAYSKLEATNAMYTSKMGGRPFNEWYQDWSTFASRSGANEETQMYAFRKALPMALHQKIMGVSPQPTTLEDLAEKAREFDRLWRMYSAPTTFNRSSGPRNRAITTDEDHAQVNVTTAPSRPPMGKDIKGREGQTLQG